MRGRLDQQNKSRQNSLIAQLGRIWEVVSKRSASQPISGCRLRRHFKQTPPGPDSGVGKRRNEMNIRGRVRMSNYAAKVNSERLGLTDVCVTLLQDTKAALLAGSRGYYDMVKRGGPTAEEFLTGMLVSAGGRRTSPHGGENLR